ncbi:hypothetical protein CY35_07G079400 [Sphagnum magellanicum]|uniref:Uncharacterized protein n=1 Tax=Sphagnum magellanicum TaxID=128215 RepID=A0ACB8HM49_9BRYO|nr:hypothetical protein CY35_07G079400 [Sphagnum magellanicum]
MMERGRDGRRSGADRNIAAPRRPRTSGFKDAAAAVVAVGEDGGDDTNTMDDGLLHNARLRERHKKDNTISSSNNNNNSSRLLMMSSGKQQQRLAVSPSSLVSIRRIKRKRQGLHEIQAIQLRSHLPDEVEETRTPTTTTHDSEMGGSEEEDDDDDDDLPPPAPIPRRPVKARPQGKLEEIISMRRNDLPTVPRKARSVLKQRAQESPPPLPPTVAPEILPHPPPPSGVASSSPNTPAPSSTLSSSSGIFALKPRRRTVKPSVSKPKATKLLKVSTRTVSEEVEVAEALFDLARMIPSPSALDWRMDSKPEYKSEAKSYSSASVQITSPVAQPSNGTATPPLLTPVANTTSTVPLGASPPPAASPVLSPSPSSAAALPPEEAAPKRKWPQVRTCPEEGVLPLQAHLVASTANVALSNLPGVVAAPESTELDQVEERHLVGIAEEEGSVKNEATGNRSSPTPAPSSPGGTPVLSVSTLSIQPKITGENKHETPEKKNAEGDVAITSSSNEKNLSYVLLPFDGNPESAKLAAAILDIQEVDAGTTSSPLLSDSAKQLDVVKRSVQLTPEGEFNQVNKFDIDLMAPPTKAAAVSLVHERNNGVAGVPVDKGQEKPLVDLSVLSPVGSGLSEKYKEERQEQQDREETEREMKREQRSKDRERTDLSKPPPQRASKGVKPESRLPKSEKALASSLLASSAASPISPGMTGWPGAMSSLGYFPVAAASMTGSSSVDKNPQPRVSPFSNIPPQQPWKRCASHIWIAHFIDAQQQVNQHPFFVAGLYGAKSYNQNMSLLPPGALYGSSGRAAQVPSVPGSPMSSAIALGVGLGVGEGALGATTISAAKDREREMIAAATFMEVFSRNAVLQQQQPILSLQPGAVFGSSGMQPGTIMMASSGLSVEVVSGIADGGANMGNPALPGISSGPGRGSLMAGSLGPAGGPGIVASNQVVAAANATAIQEQYLHVMKQNLGSTYHQYPSSHFGPTFNGPPANMGTQQAAAQFFAGVPFFGQQLVSPSQQSAHQTSLVASGGGPVPPQNQQQGVHRFPPTGSPHPQQCPLQTPSHSPSQYQVQSQSDRDGWDGPSGEDSGSVLESKFPILHRHPYSQGSASVANVSIPPAAVQTQPSHQDFSILPALGKQNKWERQQQQQHAAAQQLQVSQPQPSLSSHKHQQQQAAAQHLQIKLKGLDPQSSQAFSAMTMAAAMSRGPVGPGPLGLAPVAAVMAPQGHAVLQSMADAVCIHPRQSPHHSSGSGAPHPSLIHQQQQQMQQLQFQQQQQQHRSVQMQRGPMGVEEGHTVADTSNHTSNTGARWERDPGQDRKMSVKRPIGSSSPLSRVDFDTTPTRGNTHNETPTLNSTAATSAIMSTHPTGHIAKGGVPPPVAQAIQAPKQSMVHTKGRPGANTASTAAFNQSNMVSYADNGPPAAPSLTAKVSVPGLSLAGHTVISASNGARQTPIAQHPCLNPSQRTSMGTNPTSPGTEPKVVLAAAMAKVQKTESKLQQSLLPQVALDTGSVSRISSAISGSPTTSSTSALSPLPAGSKPSAADGAKQGSFGKGSSSFPTAQKSVGAVPGNRALSPALSQHIILGHSHSPSSSLGNKSLSAKLPQQQQQYPQPSQMHKQQNPQQQQQFSNSQSQLFPSPPPQHPQQLLQQPHHSPPLTQAHLQQNPTHQHPVQHLNQGQSAPSNNGNIANSGQSSISEVINDPQATNAGPAPSNLSASPLPGSGSQRGSSSSATAVLHSQCSSLQELNSPEQLNSVRLMKVPASMRTATSPPAASPSPLPELSSVQQIGSPTQGKSSSGQFVTGSNHGDKMLSQSSLMQPVTPSSTINGSPNHPTNNNISNEHIGSDVQPPTIVVGSSTAVQQGNVNSFQIHPPSSLSMVIESVVSTGPLASAV